MLLLQLGSQVKGRHRGALSALGLQARRRASAGVLRAWEKDDNFTQSMQHLGKAVSEDVRVAAETARSITEKQFDILRGVLETTVNATLTGFQQVVQELLGGLLKDTRAIHDAVSSNAQGTLDAVNERVQLFEGNVNGLMISVLQRWASFQLQVREFDGVLSSALARLATTIPGFRELRTRVQLSLEEVLANAESLVQAVVTARDILVGISRATVPAFTDNIVALRGTVETTLLQIESVVQSLQDAFSLVMDSILSGIRSLGTGKVASHSSRRSRNQAARAQHDYGHGARRAKRMPKTGRKLAKGPSYRHGTAQYRYMAATRKHAVVLLQSVSDLEAAARQLAT